MEVYIRKVAYHETDKMAITHHSNYIKWLEEARVFLLEKIGTPFEEIERRGIASPVVGINIQYKKTTTFGDVVEIHTKVKKYNGVKLELEYEIINQATGELAASASSSHCFIKDEGLCSLKKADPEIHDKLQAAIDAEEK